MHLFLVSIKGAILKLDNGGFVQIYQIAQPL